MARPAEFLFEEHHGFLHSHLCDALHKQKRINLDLRSRNAAHRLSGWFLGI
jgi:hypothetical protein